MDKTKYVPDSIKKAPAHIFMAKIDSAVGVFLIVADQALAVFGSPLGSILQAEDLPKGAGDRRALQSNFAVVHTINIPDQHVHSAVVPNIRHGQHVVEGPSARKQRHNPPECATTQVCSPDSFKLPWARHLNHGNAGSDIDEEVGVYVRSGLGKLHRLRVRVIIGEYFVGDLGDKEIQT